MDRVNVSTTDARKRLHGYVDWVNAGLGRVWLVRHGTVRAVLVSPEDAERLDAPGGTSGADREAEALERAALFELMNAERARLGMAPLPVPRS